MNTEEQGTKPTSLQDLTKNYVVNDGSSFPDSFYNIMKHQAKFIRVVKQFITAVPQILMVILGEIVLLCSFAFSCFGAHGVIVPKPLTH